MLPCFLNFLNISVSPSVMIAPPPPIPDITLFALKLNVLISPIVPAFILL